MRFGIAAFIFIILSQTIPSKTYAWSGKVIDISDGDTITVLNGRTPEKIRLYGIDTPESAQAFGNKATNQIKKLVVGQNADVKQYDTDKYKRTVAVITVNGKNVNRAMIETGHAWLYQKYCKEEFCREWRSLEEQARSSRIGLWRDNNPEPPWDWRKSQKQVSPNDEIGGNFHGNTRSHVLHSSQCRDFNCKACTAPFNTAEEAINAGYRPHKECVK